MESLEFMASVESLLDLYTHNKSDAMQYSNNCIDSVYNWSVYNQSDVEGERSVTQCRCKRSRSDTGN